jgi:hypothetical protein
MNSNYEKAKRIFQSLRKRLHESPIPEPDSDKHLEIVKQAVRTKFTKYDTAATMLRVRQLRKQRQKEVDQSIVKLDQHGKSASQRRGLLPGKKGQLSKETGIIIASDVPMSSSKMIADLAAKIAAAKESKAALAPIRRGAHRRKGKQVKQPKV